ncbi:MAG: patatin family protein [Oscillospiraceae bacterium]|nr:patatin family protein [Oscillospiraceae bacterium]
MKKGLILEGGAMRGMFTAGVMDVMMESGIEFDGAVGVSAGACFGCNYKSGQMGRVIRYNTRFCNDKRYSCFHLLLKEGNIFSTDFCYDEVPLQHDVFDFEAYKNNPMEFYVVATDVESGKAVYHKYEGYEDHGFDWIRASASMPLVSQMVEIEGKKYLDGGIADSIPLRFFESIGYDKNVVVLTQPEGYVKEKNPLMPAMKAKYRKYPELLYAIESRDIIYNATLHYISEKEKAGEILVIRPQCSLDIKKVEKDPEKLKAVYVCGRLAAVEKMAEIKKFLDE